MTDDSHGRTDPAVGRAVRGRAGRGAGPAVGQRALRLAARAVRPGRRPARTPGCCTGAGLLDDDELGRMLAALDDLEAASRPARSGPTVDDEDVHTALERGLLERLGTLGGKLRAGRSRNDQVATDLRLYLRDHARQRRRPGGRAASRADRARPSGTSTPPAPGMTHLQHAQPVLFGHQLLAHVHAARPRRRPAARLGPPGRAPPAGRRRAGRLVAAAGPGGRRRRAGLRARRRQLDRRRVATATSSPSSCFVAALLGVHLSRLGEEICLWTSHGVRLGRARRRLRHRARRSCRRRRTRTSPSWPAARPAG